MDRRTLDSVVRRIRTRAVEGHEGPDRDRDTAISNSFVAGCYLYSSGQVRVGDKLCSAALRAWGLGEQLAQESLEAGKYAELAAATMASAEVLGLFPRTAA